MDAASALSQISQWREQGHVIADLEWTRLTPWREPLGHVFDNTARENKFSSFHTIEVAHSGEKPTASAVYAAGWLSAPYRAKVSFKKVDGFGPGLHSITLRSDNETITFERTGKDCMTIRSTNGRERRYNYSDAALDALMTEELSIIGHDPAFDSAFIRAQELIRELR